MRVYKCEQRSAEWLKIRLGVITASSASDILYSTKRKTYFYQLLAEITTRQPTLIPINASMQWGIDHEDEARKWYQTETQQLVSQIGFCKRDDLDNVGCSPDGLVGKNGLIEIKCPGSKTHLAHVHGDVASYYITQMQFQMWITDRKWCDFVSYDPRMPDNLKGHIQRVFRNDNAIKKIEQAAEKMYDDISEFCNKYGIDPYPDE